MSYGMDGWNHDNDLVRRKDVMDSIVREYNRSRTGDGLKLAWIEKAVNEVPAAPAQSTVGQVRVEGQSTKLIDRKDVVHCIDCKHSEVWYGDKRRCFLWHEAGIDVFEDGYCNYGEVDK